MFQKTLIFIFYLHFSLACAKLALVSKPVIDLLSTPTHTLCKPLSVSEYYKHIPICPIAKNVKSRPRLHQALFNEIVDILEETKFEAKVKALNAYYLNTQTKKKISTFWTLKSNLTSLNIIGKKQQFIPTPINYTKPNIKSANTIALVEPWYCPQTKQTFSAGTRFKTNQQGKAYIYNPKTNQFLLVKIPQKFFIKQNQKNKLRQNFINLIKKWATQNPVKYIPYSWGGCSYIQRLDTKKVKKIRKDGMHFYKVSGQKVETQSGLDCSGLILRAAQTIGIPYFYKNSSTLAHEMKTLKKNEKIEPGDLIWLSGHVIIVADLNKNTCFEARGYSHGYGKVQEIHISKLFRETTNFAKLKAAHLTGKQLNRIDINGNVRGKYRIKILKLF